MTRKASSSDYLPLDRLAAADHVHSANLPGFRDLARALAGRGVPVSHDFSVSYETDDLDGLDTAFYSWPGRPDDEELHGIATAAHRGGARVVVATCGERGSVVFEEGRPTVAGAPSIVAVDTCGAGDTYAAVLLSERLGGSPLTAAMRSASEAAASSCLHLGAWEQRLDSLSEVPACP